MENSDDILDYKTPKAKLIKFVDFKSKRPLIDSTLGRVLDEFRILVKQQEKYLSNGFVDNTRIKFAEDAFFIQSVGSYYGKTVDKLHEDILQHHKRMFVSYKFIGKDMKLKEARKQEQEKLEARLNRGKRKKIKLEAPNSIDKKQKKKKPILTHNEDTDSKDLFEIYISDHDYLSERPSLILDQQTTLAFEFKIQDQNEEDELENLDYNSSECINESDEIPYIDESCCEDIPEFKKSGIARLKKAIISLFEKNDEDLIPDENLVIEKLRIAYCLRFKYFSHNKINFDKPLEEDLIGYQLYLNDFFRTSEKRKLLNMPENSVTELEKFCKALAAKETLAHGTIQSLKRQKKRKLPSVNFQTVILDPLKKSYKGPFDPYIPTGLECDDIDKNENTVPPLLEFIEEREISDQSEITTDENDHKLPEINLNTSIAEDSENDNYDDADNDDSTSEEDELPENNDKTEKVTAKLTEKNAQTEKIFDKLTENKAITKEVTNNVTEEVTKEVSDHGYSRFNGLPQLQIKLIKLDTNVAKGAENDNEDDKLSEKNDKIEKVTAELNTNNDKTEQLAFKFNEEITEKVPALKRRPVRDCSKNLSKVFIAAGKSPSNRVDNDIQDDLEYVEDSDDSVSSAKRAYVPNFLDDSDDSEYSDSDVDLSPKKMRLNDTEISTPSTIPGVKLLDWKSSQPSKEYQAKKLDDLDDFAEPMDTDDEDNNEYLFDTNEDFEFMSGDDDYNSEDEKITFRKAFKPEKMQNNATLNRLLSSKINLFVERPKSPETSINFEELYEMEKRGMAERINQWKEFITPKLEQIKGKTFSIQQYQSKIIDEVNVNRKKKFKEIIRGKSVTEAIRLFLTTMHLVTLRNLEISGTKPVELCNDTMSLKLLSKEQIQQRLARYHAPSELIQQERMEKLRTRSSRPRKIKN